MMKKHCFLFAILTTFALLTAAAMVVIADPFFHYHKPLDGLYYLIDNKISQNPGIAAHFSYDSIITGSSMTVNFDTALFAEKLGVNTVKLSYDGAYPKDVDTILTLVEQSPNEVNTIFFNIDIFTYKAAPGMTAYAIPEYLYNDILLDDIPYLLNKWVILDYILRPQVEQEGTPLPEAYSSWRYMYYGPEIVAKTYHAPTAFSDALPENAFSFNVSTNLETYILPHIEKMPDTLFVIFFPPYSVLYWYNCYANGSLAAELAAEKQAIETLLAFPNVEIYYFQNQFDYITDLNNYSDYIHYRHEMNDYMTICFSDGSNRLTADNYLAVLEEMRTWLEDCPFETYVP